MWNQTDRAFSAAEIVSFVNYACMPLEDRLIVLLLLDAHGRSPVWHQWCGQVGGTQATLQKFTAAYGPTAHLSFVHVRVGAWAVGCRLATALHSTDCSAQQSADRTRIAVCGIHDAAWKATHTGYSEHYRAKTNRQRQQRTLLTDWIANTGDHGIT